MASTTSGENRKELLEIADAVAREKGIQSEEVLAAMETAIQKASRAKYGHERDIRATIDRKTGEISLFLCHEVVEELENEATQYSLDQARKYKPDAEIGDMIKDPLPPVDLGRVAAGTARQVIIQEVREVERQHQYEEFKDRIGEVINGQIKRVEFGNVMVALGQAEALLPKDQLIPREMFGSGDRVRAYITDVRNEPRGSQIFLSRTHPQFMAQLFTQEVPEIYDGEIEIKAVARDPGSRAKMAVLARDSSMDPVGACVGMRGSRVQAVVNELRGEKVDIIPWSSDVPTFVVNALVPAEAKKVVMDEENERIEVVVPDDQLSLAIGRRGQNVRLASALTGYNIDVISEKEESERRSEEVKKRSALFEQALDVDDVLAHLLISEGFESVEEVALVDVQELISIEGLDEDLATELQTRAKNFLAQQDAELNKQVAAMKVSKDLVALEGLSPKMLVTLGEKGIKTLDDFADLASDELREILPDISVDASNDLISAARAHWFADEESKKPAEKAPEPSDGASEEKVESEI